MHCLLKVCNNLIVQCQRSSWNLTNLLVDFWIICHGAVFSVPILLSRRSALCFLHLVTLLNLCFICKPHSLLYALGSTLWILHHNHPFLSSILTFHYHFLILPVTVILVGMIVMLGPLVEVGFHTRLEILN